MLIYCSFPRCVVANFSQHAPTLCAVTKSLVVKTHQSLRNVQSYKMGTWILDAWDRVLVSMTCLYNTYSEPRMGSIWGSWVGQLYRTQNNHQGGEQKWHTSDMQSFWLSPESSIHSKDNFGDYLNDKFAFGMQHLLLIWRDSATIDKLDNPYLAVPSGRVWPWGKMVFGDT